MKAAWTPSNPCLAPPWTASSGCRDPGWTSPTVCRRPYGRGAYGRGPYGRCAIVGGSDWAPPGQTGPADPLWTPAEACA